MTREFWGGFIWGTITTIAAIVAFVFMLERIANAIDRWHVNRLCKRTFFVDGTKREDSHEKPKD
jgi:hypothetical protein